jgi:F-type H+/Na+-transporting ATPase subunit alpha
MDNNGGGPHFQRFVAAGNPVGDVVAINNFLIEVRGLQPVNVHALVIFEDGSRGFVQRIFENKVLVLHLGTSQLRIGMVAVVQQTDLTVKVGKDFIGRVISATGEPLDGKGAIAADANWPVFHVAPPIYAREHLDTQLETGVTLVDTLFPIVRGQRMALLGDSKSGKSTLATQIAINQRNTDQVVIYVMIAKRRSDIDTLLTRLTDNKAMGKSIVVVSTIFESLVMSYLAPYVGCALGEYLWQVANQDTIVIYDDLTTHAHAYREISLLAGVSPGRDSYPGDIFYSHSNLLERAGKLIKNHKHQTAIPLVLADGGDITAYLPTNIMSITDGQWILDMEIFRAGLRPPLSIGLSVTRVGSRGHNKRQKSQTARALKLLADFAKAEEFAHFGSDLEGNIQKDITRGRQFYELLTQVPGETYSLMAQQLMLDLLLDPEGANINIDVLKRSANEAAAQVKSEDEDYERARIELRERISGAGST